MEFTPKQSYPSARWKLNGRDARKILKSFGLALAGLILVWVGDVLIPGISLSSSWGPFAGALAPVLVNLGRKIVGGSPS